MSNRKAAASRAGRGVGRSFKRSIARAYLRVSGWKLVIEQEPPRDGAVFLGVPHTSKWDLPLVLAITWSTDIKIKWVGKQSLFRFPLGPLLKILGGIPIDRESPGGIVESLSAQLTDEPGWALVITPEGTRSKREYWKSGFYRIAQATGLPLVLGFVDKATRTTGIGPVFHVTGDVRADMDRIREFYSGMVGIRPGDEGEPRLRMEERD